MPIKIIHYQVGKKVNKTQQKRQNEVYFSTLCDKEIYINENILYKDNKPKEKQEMCLFADCF